MRFPLLAGTFAILAAAAGAVAYTTLDFFNYFNEVEDRFAGVCSPVTGVAGPEDIDASSTSGRAFLSSLDRREGRDARGAVFAVLLADPLDSENWRDRTLGKPGKFRPLGLNYYEEGDVRRLFVVNEAVNGVEIYDVLASGDLNHLKTVVERRLTSPNDVVAVGPESFYVSNDVEPGRNSFLGKLFFLARLASGKIYYYDGVSMRLAAEKLKFANGLALNARGTRLYAAQTSGNAISIYDRDPASGDLTLSKVEQLPASPDNLNIAWDGSVWIGAQPKPLTIPLLLRDASKVGPSLVLRYVDNRDGAAPMTEIFSSKGDAISTSSVAAIAGGKLLIGAMLDDKYLICDLPG